MTGSPLVGAGLVGMDRMLTTTDGRSLRAMERGTGDDLVVLEAGLGISGLCWGPVHERLGRRVRVVAYERAGLGASDPDTATRDLARLADDLEDVIARVPHRRLVLAGHSWGGPVVREVAARRIRRGLPLQGVVLVDPSDERADMYASHLARIAFPMQAAMLVPLARAGLLAPLVRTTVAELDGPLRDAVVRASCSPAAARATASEQRHVLAGLAALRSAPDRLAGVPVRILSGTRATLLGRSARAGLRAAHRASAQAMHDGRLVRATGSEHMIPVTEPDLVAAQVLALLHDEV